MHYLRYIIWSSNKKVWMPPFSLYFDQYSFCFALSRCLMLLVSDRLGVYVLCTYVLVGPIQAVFLGSRIMYTLLKLPLNPGTESPISLLIA